MNLVITSNNLAYNKLTNIVNVTKIMISTDSEHLLFITQKYSGYGAFVYNNAKLIIFKNNQQYIIKSATIYFLDKTNLYIYH